MTAVQCYPAQKAANRWSLWFRCLLVANFLVAVGNDDVPSVILARKSDAEACFTNEHRFFRYFFLVHSGCKYVRVLVAY